MHRTECLCAKLCPTCKSAEMYCVPAMAVIEHSVGAVGGSLLGREVIEEVYMCLGGL